VTSANKKVLIARLIRMGDTAARGFVPRCASYHEESFSGLQQNRCKGISEELSNTPSEALQFESA
jgi:hypothetical protein